ncbi:hypothetical protein GQ42DRAFT_162131 [Ramicandelaber brevisporus]|nr:hypothetical protein GQ42DRAFT_162131 [Ramicandelaber brevisporus]
MLFKWLKPGSKRNQSSSSSNSNGRLFVLPYELLEEIATTYFSRYEAVALLTVNSQFHTAFSRAVWHTLDANRYLIRSMPGETWQHYGHLVRCVRMEIHQLNAQWCARMPNVVELTLQLCHLSSVTIDGLELLSLRCIRFVTYEIEWTASDATMCMDLVHQLEQRNKSLLVRWELVLMFDEHIAALDTVVNRIDDTSRYSLFIKYLVHRPLIFSQFSKLSRMLVKLVISDWNGHFKDFLRHCNSSSSNHGNNTGCTFPRLAALQLYPQRGLAEDRFMASAVTPAHFPSLKTMEFRLSDDICHLPGFSVSASHSWSTITELRFLSSSDGNVVSQALKQVPNLERLVFERCRLELEIASLVTDLPRLKYFEFGTMVRLEGDGPDNIHTPVVSLKEIVFRFGEYDIHYDYATSRELLMKFIFNGGAPGLRSLEFKGQKAVDWKKYTLKQGPQVNTAVRTLVLLGSHKNFNVSGLPELRTMFPNLKFLTLRESTDATRKKLVKRYPYLIVTVEPVTTYHFPSSISKQAV